MKGKGSNGTCALYVMGHFRVANNYSACNGSVNWWNWYEEYYSYFIWQRVLL